MLNKNTLGVKKVRGQSETAYKRAGMKKGGQVTKPIIPVKIYYKLLYVIQGIENSFGKVTSWPQLISEFLVAHTC